MLERLLALGKRVLAESDLDRTRANLTAAQEGLAAIERALTGKARI